MINTLRLIKRLETALGPKCAVTFHSGKHRMAPEGLYVDAYLLWGLDINYERFYPVEVLEWGGEEFIYKDFTEEALATAETYRRSKLRKCPFRDCHGGELAEGDVIEGQLTGRKGTIIFRPEHDAPEGQWAIKFEDGSTTRLKPFLENTK